MPPTVLQLLSFAIDYGMDLEAAFHTPRIDPVRLEAVSCDHRLPVEAIEAIRRVAPVKVNENAVYPVMFACAGAVARDWARGRNSGMTTIDLPYATPVTEEEVSELDRVEG